MITYISMYSRIKGESNQHSIQICFTYASSTPTGQNDWRVSTRLLSIAFLTSNCLVVCVYIYLARYFSLDGDFEEEKA